jgi:predicted P-loop ATPase
LIAAAGWIIELSELTAMRHSELADANAFLTRRKDEYRPPYGRQVVSQPRGCVFVGTTNVGAIGYLKDATGGRRFWPCEVGRIRLDKLKKDLPLLYAEAVFRYRRGECWWPDTPKLQALFSRAQGERYEGDVWEETILDTATQLGTAAKTARVLGFTLEKLIVTAFPGLEKHRIDRAMETRVGRILSDGGYARRWTTSGKRRVRVYYRKRGSRLKEQPGST